MKKLFFIFLILLLTVIHSTQAEALVFVDTFDSFTLGDLSGQGGWAVTKYYTDTLGTVKVTASDVAPEEKYVEIINNDSIIFSRISTPSDAGVLQFKMRHSKSGLFYLYAQTSDAGGQLLFSIQFTQSNGILLEEAGKQTTLLSDYNPNQWYSFSIDFDNTKGDRGKFTIQIDGVDYGERSYVDSESELFDFAQISLGSESDGATSVSAFDNFISTMLATTTATTAPTSDMLRQLSISLSTTSITSNLDNGLIVTATLDGIASIATTTATVTTEVVTEPQETFIGEFITDIIENVIEIFVPSEPTEEEVIVAPQTEPEITEDNQELENAIQSSVSSDVTTDETVTTTF